MPKPNGHSDTESKDLSLGAKLDLLIEAMAQQSDLIQELRDQQTELVDKLANLEVGGTGFSFDSVDN